MIRRPARTPRGRTRHALDDADREADQVELARLHEVGVLGHLAAEQRAPGLPAAVRDAADDLVDRLGHELADRDVVEEEERLGALHRDVVDRHRDEVDADRVVATGDPGDHRLRARRRRSTTRGAGRCEALAPRANSPPKPPMSPTTSGRKVERTCALISSTAFSPAAMSTPGVA